MAIQLPKPSQKAFSETPSRKAVPRAPQVEQQRMISDPGVNAPAGAFGGLEAEAIGDVSNVFMDVAIKQQSREDAVSRSAAKNEYRRSVEEAYQNILTEDDLSKPETLRMFGDVLSKTKQELINSYSGSADSQARLSVALGEIEASYIGNASGEAVRLGKAKIEKALNDDMSPLIHSVMTNPTPENLQEQMLASDRLITDEYVDGFSSDEEDLRIDSGRELLASKTVEGLLSSGNIEEAQAIFHDPLVFNSLSEKSRSIISSNIQTAITKKNAVQIEVQKAVAVEKAKAQARMDIIQTALMPSVAKTPQPDASFNGQFFADGTEASADYSEAMRLYGTAKRLFMAGETSMANGFMVQARFIMENSPSVQKQQELNKPMSEQLAGQFGVPIGTTLAEAQQILGERGQSLVPKSPGDLAAERTEGQERAKAKVKGEETTQFANEASSLIEDLLEDMKEDPKIVGIGGSLRSTGQSALGVLSDLGMDSVVQTAKDIAFESDADLDIQSGLFDLDDPNLSVLSLLENSIGMILARLRTPTGRVPVEVIKRSIDDVKLTGLTSADQVKTRLTKVNKMLKQRMESIGDRTGQRQPTNQPLWKIQNGKLERVR